LSLQRHLLSKEKNTCSIADYSSKMITASTKLYCDETSLTVTLVTWAILREVWIYVAIFAQANVVYVWKLKRSIERALGSEGIQNENR
jgi:hypothetical protein